MNVALRKSFTEEEDMIVLKSCKCALPQLNVTLKTFMHRKQRHAALRVCYIRFNRKTIPHFFKERQYAFFKCFKTFLGVSLCGSDMEVSTTDTTETS